jgi:hypothetical protein
MNDCMPPAGVDETVWINGYRFTEHALSRMNSRRIPLEAIAATIDYGQIVQTRGAVFFALSRKAIEQENLAPQFRRFEGTHVVCTNNIILTVYRSRDLSRLRRRERCWRRLPCHWHTQLPAAC